MYLIIYIYIYICMCVYIYECMCVHVRACVHVCICVTGFEKTCHLHTKINSEK